MESSISWVDSEGAATLTNGKSGVGTRFSDWVVARIPVGPITNAPGTGLPNRTIYRTDQTVTFQINAIPEASMSLMTRLQYHLLKGGIATLVGDRELASQFAYVKIAPGTEPQIQQSDPVNREYTLSLALRGVPSPTLPPPDAFASRTTLTGTIPGTDTDPGVETCISTDNVDATMEDGEPDIFGFIEKTLWFEWVALVTGEVTFRTTSTTPPRSGVIGIYQGTSFGDMTLVGWDFGYSGAECTVDVTEGETYFIQLGSVAGNEDAGQMTLCWVNQRKAAIINWSYTYVAERTIRCEASLGTHTGYYNSFAPGGTDASYGSWFGSVYDDDATFKWEFFDAGGVDSDGNTTTTPLQSPDDTSGPTVDHQFDPNLFLFAYPDGTYSEALGWFGNRLQFYVKLTITQGGRSVSLQYNIPTTRPAVGGVAGPRGGVTAHTQTVIRPDGAGGTVTEDWSSAPIEVGHVNSTVGDPGPYSGDFTLNFSITDFGVTRSGSVSKYHP